MIKRTYGQLKNKLGRVAALNGFRGDDARLIDRVNDAIEDMMESEDYPFIIDRLVFANPGSDNIFVLPNSVDRIVNITIDDQPIFIRSPWFEYIDSAFGRIEDPDARDFIGLERGEVPTFKPVPSTGGPFFLKIKAEVDETANGVFHVRGLDDNGEKVFTAGAEGLDISYTAGSPFETVTTQRFSSVTQVSKSPTTGKIKLFATTDPGGVDTEIGNYEPKDEAASFRQYSFPTLAADNAREITIRGKRRFIPITNDNDILDISNFWALRFMLIAHHKAETQDEAGYTANTLLAQQKMWEQSKSYRGKTKTPVQTSESGSGTGDFGPII